ncbi:MAG: NADH-quinone oxidoreductase subunit NuoB [Candidatus Omnitrophica bacterium]|nr:NADH-quinone oxidoreductase subunit NuoB [Candidatus Omnitrophota bacterium]MBU1047304.1 NADH-quinone oxidoreductase subunit NuoB [Candidatus Omnitrophota bacterium]MBU1630632.1 NADH-quinone oxidoreductase subunit NuoB [Candidatus Omnitrophota bacterium]MBU1767361.1 NADH-quinone oxidoreductase subunit NuoB [Candidatus Omnitrophota bacterium]MBU1889111.1 NADH-quinone oxidoreductase subunit NuoB [Candidatus Omnitrophota bacterium]
MSVKLKALLKSPWVFHLSTGSCNNCDIEILDCLTPRFDIERFGMLLASSIRHADVLLVTGSGNRKSMEIVKRLYEQMPKPGLVVAIGECAMSRGMFIHSYNCPVPIDKIIPVDVYIPGCPPKPEAIIAGVVKLIEKLNKRK